MDTFPEVGDVIVIGMTAVFVTESDGDGTFEVIDDIVWDIPLAGHRKFLYHTSNAKVIPLRSIQVDLSRLHLINRTGLTLSRLRTEYKAHVDASVVLR